MASAMHGALILREVYVQWSVDLFQIPHVLCITSHFAIAVVVDVGTLGQHMQQMMIAVQDVVHLKLPCYDMISLYKMATVVEELYHCSGRTLLIYKGLITPSMSNELQGMVGMSSHRRGPTWCPN